MLNVLLIVLDVSSYFPRCCSSRSIPIVLKVQSVRAEQKILMTAPLPPFHDKSYVEILDDIITLSVRAQACLRNAIRKKPRSVWRSCIGIFVSAFQRKKGQKEFTTFMKFLAKVARYELLAEPGYAIPQTGWEGSRGMITLFVMWLTSGNAVTMFITRNLSDPLLRSFGFDVDNSCFGADTIGFALVGGIGWSRAQIRTFFVLIRNTVGAKHLGLR